MPSLLPLSQSFKKYIDSSTLLCNRNDGFNLSISSIEKSFLINSEITPSSPILSILSSATVNSIKRLAIPQTSAIPDNIFLLFTLITTGRPILLKAKEYKSIISTSCHKLFEPTTSASHCKNSRYRPFWGLSALHTG